MPAAPDLIRRVFELDCDLARADAENSVQWQDFALDRCAEILDNASAADEVALCEALDALIRRYGLEQRAFERAHLRM